MEAFDPHGIGQNKLLNGVLAIIVESIYVHSINEKLRLRDVEVFSKIFKTVQQDLGILLTRRLQHGLRTPA